MSEAVRDLEVELHGFYLATTVTEGDPPQAPDEVRPVRLTRFNSGDVVATLDLSLRDTGILQRQLAQGVDAPRQVARLAQKIGRQGER